MAESVIDILTSTIIGQAISLFPAWQWILAIILAIVGIIGTLKLGGRGKTPITVGTLMFLLVFFIGRI